MTPTVVSRIAFDPDQHVLPIWRPESQLNVGQQGGKFAVTFLKQSLEKLLSSSVGFDYQQNWNDKYITMPDGGRKYFTENLRQILDVVRHEIGADASCAFFSGFAIGYYSVVERVKGIFQETENVPTGTAKQFFYSWLGRTEGGTIIVASPSRCLAVMLYNGELFGFLCFESFSEPLKPEGIADLKKSASLLIYLIAELTFSFRVRSLAEPFETYLSNDALNVSFEQHIAIKTGLAFGADGVVFRLYDRSTDMLEIHGYAGSICDQLEEPASLNGSIEGRVFGHSDVDWASVVLDKAELDRGLGSSSQDTEHLRQCGIRAILSVRLTSPLATAGSSAKIGTLSYFFVRPHRFSWRDVALFRSFCQRVADAIILREQQRDLETNANIVAVQSRLMTSVEIAALISHDLFHKAFNAAHSFDKYKKQVHKALGQRSLHLVDEQEKEAESTLRRVHDSVVQLRSISKAPDDDHIETRSFTMRDVINEVIETLAGAFVQQSIEPVVVLQQDFTTIGPRQILLQAIFNLAINTIDAVKNRRRPRRVKIHFHGKINGKMYELQVWDEGPGINRVDFREPREIFEIGRTTKRDGSGMGLPVARTLLHRHFRADLTLEDPETALFLIRIPLSV